VKSEKLKVKREKKLINAECSKLINQNRRNFMKKDFFTTTHFLALLLSLTIALPEIALAASGKEPPKTEKVQMLFVQNAQQAELSNNKLVLRGMSPTTLFFSDRPDRIAGHMPTSEILPLWKDGKDSFTADTPMPPFRFLTRAKSRTWL
jgi:hypothetical protein